MKKVSGVWMVVILIGIFLVLGSGGKKETLSGYSSLSSCNSAKQADIDAGELCVGPCIEMDSGTESCLDDCGSGASNNFYYYHTDLDTCQDRYDSSSSAACQMECLYNGVPTTPDPLASCTDSDGGQIATTKGTVNTDIGQNCGNGAGQPCTDACTNNGAMVLEFWCNGNTVDTVALNCPTSTTCQLGECKQDSNILTCAQVGGTCSATHCEYRTSCTEVAGTCGTGQYCCAGSCCVETTWTPEPATKCTGVSFTQTSNCGTTRSSVGTNPECDENTVVDACNNECTGFIQNCDTASGKCKTSGTVWLIGGLFAALILVKAMGGKKK